jgi:glycosyltransferase involved in cell wall biosynthesis
MNRQANGSLDSAPDRMEDDPLRLLIIDKVSVLASIRERWGRLAEQARVDLTLLAPDLWIENFAPAPFERSSGEPFRTILGKTVWPGKEQRGFYRSGMFEAFRASRPEVILMMEESFSLFALQAVLLKKLLAPRARVIFYSNNIVSYDRYTYRPSWFYRLLGKSVMRMCDVGLCVNEAAERVLRESGFSGEIRTLFYGINERLFEPRCSGEARRKLGLPADAGIFLYAGKLLPLKGVQDLLDAFARLRRELPDRDLRLVIVGRGEFSGELRRISSRLGLDDAVIFHDVVPLEMVPTYMSAATALVLPSRAGIEEQFGRVIAEAMLMNVPVIGSTSGAIPSVIGEGGFLFSAGDVDELKRTMRRVLDDRDEVERRVALGRNRAMRSYSMNAFVDGLVGLFEELIGRDLRRRERA